MQFDYFYPEQADQYAFYRIPRRLFTDNNFKELTAVLEEYTDKKTECKLIEEEGMYIPSKSSVVEVKPVFEEEKSEE